MSNDKVVDFWGGPKDGDRIIKDTVTSSYELYTENETHLYKLMTISPKYYKYYYAGILKDGDDE